MAFTYRSLTKPRNEFYLIYFDTDETVSVVNKKAIVEEKCLEVGDYCQVKVKKQVFKGRVVSYGCKDDVVSLEEQFLAGVYTPDFLPPVSSDEEPEDRLLLSRTPTSVTTSNDDVLLNCTPVNKEKSKKRKSAGNTDRLKEKTEKKAKRKKVTEKQSTITLLAISNHTEKSNKKSTPADITTSTGDETNVATATNKPFEEPDTDTSVLPSQIAIYSSESDISPLPSPIPELSKEYNSQYSKTGYDDFNEIVASLNTRIDKLEAEVITLTSKYNAVLGYFNSIHPLQSFLSTFTQMLPMQQHTTPAPVSQVPANISSPATIPSTVVSSSPTPAVSSSSKPASAVSDSVPSHSGTTKSEAGEVLLPPDEVLKKYPKLVSSTSNIGRLAVRLAVEAYFGKELLKQCTVYGFNNRAALPKHQVLALKTKLLNIFPQYLSSPVDFEPLWNKCVAAINHCAAGFRAKKVIEIDC